MNTHGYSGTPLVRKLGIKTGFTLLVRHAPEDYAEFIGELPDDVGYVAGDSGFDFAHVFVRNSSELDIELAHAMHAIRPDGMIWISWYKKASKIKTDVTEDVIREKARALGLVDVKVCAVDGKWSGLKLVIRRENRT